MPSQMPHAPYSHPLAQHEPPDLHENQGRRRMKIIAGLLIAAALAFTSGCAKTDWIDRTLVTVDVTGTWSGSVGGSQGGFMLGDLLLELNQQGSVVKGTLRQMVSGGPVGSQPIEGTVAGDMFRFRDARGSMEGELTVSGDEMTGKAATAMGSRPISLRRVNSSSPPASPPR